MALSHRIPSLLAASGIYSYGTGVLRPSLTSLITQKVGREEQGVVLGLTQSLFSIAQITAPVLAGFLIGQQQLAAWAVLAAMTTFAGFLVSLPKVSDKLIHKHGN